MLNREANGRDKIKGLNKTTGRWLKEYGNMECYNLR